LSINNRSKFISDYSETDPILHLEQLLADVKLDIEEFKKMDEDNPEEERCKGERDALSLCLAYLTTLSPMALERLARINLNRTHKLLDTSDINLNPPKDASILSGTYWCVDDVRNLFGLDVTHMTDDEIAEELHGLTKWMVDHMTQIGWEHIEQNFTIKENPGDEEE